MIDTYHKIPTIYKRDPATNHRTLLDGEYATPELEYLAHNTWTFTEKVDGTNIRVWWDHDTATIQFGGKSDRAQIPAKLVAYLRDKFAFAHKWFIANSTPEEPVCLYGEGHGAGIQKGGGNYSQVQQFVLFDVKVGLWWLRRLDVEDVAASLGIPVVPIIGAGTLHAMVARAQEGITSQWGDFQAEGIVARPQTELFARNGHRIITKIKTKDFA